MKRPLLSAVAWLLLTLALGAVAAVLVNHTLRVEFGTKTIPDDRAEDILPRLAELTANPSGEPAAIAGIVLPAGFDDDVLLQTAADELAGAVQERTGRTPTVSTDQEGALEPAGALQIAVSIDQAPGEPVSGHPPSGQSAESYTLSAGVDGRWIISSPDSRGAARGVFRVADAIRSGYDESRLGSLFDGREIVPALARRLVDLGGVGMTPNSAAWRLDDYSHNGLAFADLVLPNPPYVDQRALADYEAQTRTYLTRMASYGYNGVVFEGFLQFVDFDKVGTGVDVYPQDSPDRARHEALREAYTRLFQYADSLGFDLYLYTDMLALTAPLQSYFNKRLGGLDAENLRLWEVYRLGLEELFERLPLLDGLMIRVGEAGAVYNRPASGYWSSLAVRTKSAVQTMLRELSGAAAKQGKEIIFRSWSVGLGEAGKMHTDPAVYEKVLGPVSATNLLISTKFVQGDFESFLPLNPTLSVGSQSRLIEFQARREYEGFSTFPNYLARAHQISLQTERLQGDRVDGVWVWTQMGGPVRAGPMSLYPFYGPYDPVDANVYATARLAWDPDVDLAQVTLDWVGRTYGPRDRSVAGELARLTLESHEVATSGIYVSDYSRRLVLVGGRDAGAIGRLFQWDILNGATSELALVYKGLSQGEEAAITEGFTAVERVKSLLRAAQSIPADQVTYPARLAALENSLRYELSMFGVLAAYRETFLIYQRWLDAGRSADLDRWRLALAEFQKARAGHVASYGGSVEFPPLNFYAADRSLAHARRGVAMAWGARIWLVLVGLFIASGCGLSPGRPRCLSRLPGEKSRRSLFWGTFAPWRLAAAPGNVGRPHPAHDLLSAAAALILVLAGVSVFSSFLSPSLLLLTVLLLIAVWIPVLLVNFRSSRAAWAAVAGPQLLVTGLVLIPVAVRGPLYFWQEILFGQPFRSIFLPIFVMAALWPLFTLFAFYRSTRNGPSALALSTLGIGTSVTVAAAAAFLIGTEQVVSRLNTELAILPFALSRTLGLTTYLNVSNRLTLVVAVGGAGFVLLTCFAAWLLGGRAKRSTA